MTSKSIIATLIISTAFTFTSQAATSFIIDAKANCISTVSGSDPAAYLKFRLPAGRYVLSLVSNTMSCSSWSSTDGCKINVVYLNGGMGTLRWGATVTDQPIVIDSTTPDYIAAVLDDFCSDNKGQATILAEKAD